LKIFSPWAGSKRDDEAKAREDIEKETPGYRNAFS